MASPKSKSKPVLNSSASPLFGLAVPLLSESTAGEGGDRTFTGESGEAIGSRAGAIGSRAGAIGSRAGAIGSRAGANGRSREDHGGCQSSPASFTAIGVSEHPSSSSKAELSETASTIGDAAQRIGDVALRIGDEVDGLAAPRAESNEQNMRMTIATEETSPATENISDGQDAVTLSAVSTTPIKAQSGSREGDGSPTTANGSFLGANGSFLGANGSFLGASGSSLGASGSSLGASGSPTRGASNIKVSRVVDVSSSSSEEELGREEELENEWEEATSTMISDFVCSPVFLFVVAFYICGIAMYTFTAAEDWADNYFPEEGGKPELLDCIIQGAYFATQVVTTIGFGDVTPKTDWLRTLNTFYVLAGVGVTANLVVRFIQSNLHSTLERDSQIRFKTTLAKVGGGSEYKEVDHAEGGQRDHTRPSGSDRSNGKNGRRQNTKTATASEMEHRNQQELLHATGLIAFPVVFGGAVYGYCLNWSPMKSMHWAMVASSSIGFGDANIGDRWLRLFSCFFLIIAVAMFGVGVSKFSNIILTQQLVGPDGEFLAKMTLEDALKFDRDGDKQVDKFEFAVGVLLACGKTTQEEFDAIRERFEEFDLDGNGVLNSTDLRLARQRRLRTSRSLSQWGAPSFRASFNLGTSFRRSFSGSA
ncbi:unnamed protein product [Amoebophrya sp. A25]|nr:unnamed protein product [Amoebophrya sp. A25]|eukprot:GSA25T00020278001.1